MTFHPCYFLLLKGRRGPSHTHLKELHKHKHRNCGIQAGAKVKFNALQTVDRHAKTAEVKLMIINDNNNNKKTIFNHS